MCPQYSGSSSYAMSSEESPIRKLYEILMDGWNQRDAQKLGSVFDDDGRLIGHDGLHCVGAQEVEESFTRIFHDSTSSSFLTEVREIRFLSHDVAQLEAFVRVVSPAKMDRGSQLDAFQVMTAVRRSGRWVVMLLQSTSAQPHDSSIEGKAMPHPLMILK